MEKMKTLTIKKLDVVSVANFAAVLAAAVVAAEVLISWLVALVNYAQLSAHFPNIVSWNTGFGVLAIILLPALAAVAGWIGGAVVAWFYNVALGGSNGIKIEVEE